MKAMVHKGKFLTNYFVKLPPKFVLLWYFSCLLPRLKRECSNCLNIIICADVVDLREKLI